MQNWIGVGVWIVLGAVIGLAMQALVKLPSARPGHTGVIAVFGSFGAVIGGMLGVGILEFEDPRALSLGGLAGAVFLSVLLTWTYRWGCRTAT
jgi:ABC-type Fe3+-siderophore transport system permease subunit